VAGIQKANRQMEDLVALKKALLSQLMETEKKDRKYIDLQLKEIGQIDREQLAVNAQQAEFMKGLSESQNVEGLLQHRLEAFEKAFAKKQVKTLDAVNAKEKQMLELLGDIKRLASSAQYSQERLISNLLKYKEK
jgi:predicted  nucleic acid-binding Zn-ribbon protein